MKSRMTLILIALIAILSTLVFIVQDRKSPADAAQNVPQMIATVAPLQPVAIEVQAAPITPQAVAVTPATEPSAAASVAQVDVAEKSNEAKPLVRVTPAGNLEYVARDGDTLSQLAIALVGADSKANRDAVVAANETLQANPDRVLSGHTYSMTLASTDASTDAAQPAADTATAMATSKKESTPAEAVETVATPALLKTPASVKSSDSDVSGPLLKYTARPGDTVHVLAAQLLGDDTKTNRDVIIAANPSLQSDPDHLVAGRTYTIVAANGLAASASGPHAAVDRSNFSAEPDADEAAQLGVGRTLRYTALPGDTVTKLTMSLLGSDTAANRNLIIEANPSLKRDPDHLIAGKTYWIAAPTSDSSR